MFIINYVLNHPALLLLALPAVPSVLGRLEKAAIAKLLRRGDSSDQKLLRSIASAVVTWAEEKGAEDGAGKFAVADKLLARALPFLSADQRKDLIEGAIDELDKEAREAIADAAPPPESHQ